MQLTFRIEGADATVSSAIIHAQQLASQGKYLAAASQLALPMKDVPDHKLRADLNRAYCELQSWAGTPYIGDLRTWHGLIFDSVATGDVEGFIRGWIAYKRLATLALMRFCATTPDPRIRLELLTGEKLANDLHQELPDWFSSANRTNTRHLVQADSRETEYFDRIQCANRTQAEAEIRLAHS